MRHNNKVKKLGKEKSHREAMLRNLATSIILYEKVKTTEAKAKEAVKIVEKLITASKDKSQMLAIRKIQKVVYDKNASKKLIESLKDRYKDRQSGFTRITAIKNLFRQVKPGGYLLLTFDYPRVNLEEIEKLIGLECDKTGDYLNGYNSISPNNKYGNLNIIYLILEKA